MFFFTQVTFWHFAKDRIVTFKKIECVVTTVVFGMHVRVKGRDFSIDCNAYGGAGSLGHVPGIVRLGRPGRMFGSHAAV
jgi:hypothetical protein